MSKLRVQRALRHATPGAASEAIQPGGKVLVRRERLIENRIGEWIGPFTVLAIDENQYDPRQLVSGFKVVRPCARKTVPGAPSLFVSSHNRHCGL
jgi:hypothetical protein